MSKHPKESRKDKEKDILSRKYKIRQQKLGLI